MIQFSVPLYKISEENRKKLIETLKKAQRNIGSMGSLSATIEMKYPTSKR